MIEQRISTVIRILPPVGLILLIAGCSMISDLSDRIYGTEPAVADSGGFKAIPPPDVERIPVPANGRHTVERGNTVYAIARLYGVPVRAIIEANSLEPPYLLRVGDSLRVPSPRVHEIDKGDTVYSISRRYGVPMNELMRANGISPPYTIVIGQILTIPQAGSTAVAVAAHETDDDDAPGRPAAQPRATPAQVAALPNPPRRSGDAFEWPVRGKVILGFGRQSGGSNNDGINIAVPRGAKVAAAENGIVAYAGNELRGFGNLVLVKHADGFMTAYGHNEELLVVRGQKVRKGQVIARAGSSGNVATPQLHFEIRKGRSAVDPLRYLPRQSAGG